MSRSWIRPGSDVELDAAGRPRGELLRRVVERPTVEVELLRLPGGAEAWWKRYCFPRAGQRWRSCLGHTGLGTPKVRREARSLLRLEEAGVPAARALAWSLRRAFPGLVRDGGLLTATWDGARTLEEQPGEVQDSIWLRIGASLRRMHDAGCFHRRLAPRNLVLDQEVPDRPRLAWIDLDQALWRRRLPDAARAWDLLAFVLPAPERFGVRAWTLLTRGYGRWEDAGPAELRAALPGSWQRSLGRRLERERRRRVAERRTGAADALSPPGLPSEPR